MARFSNGIDYIEFRVRDMARTKAFYAAAFGWDYTDYGPGYCEFNSGSLKGGFELLEDGQEPTTGGALVVLWSDDLEASREQVLAAIGQFGGRLSRETFAFPGGRRFHFCDPNGYELAIWTEA